jgi:hypothetical protein
MHVGWLLNDLGSIPSESKTVGSLAKLMLGCLYKDCVTQYSIQASKHNSELCAGST